MQAENENTKAKAVEPSYLDIFLIYELSLVLLNSVGFSSIKIKIRLILFVTICIEQ